MLNVKRKAVSGILMTLLLMSFLMSIFNIQPVEAETITWTVDDDRQDFPSADFTKIQDAVNNATTGDTILVYPGTYIENIDVNKDRLTIRSESGAEVTIVQAANPDDPVFEVTENYVNIIGFTVKTETHVGICLDGVKNGNILHNIAAHARIGILLANSEDNYIANNNINSNNRGLSLAASHRNIITDNIIRSEKPYNYIGIDLFFGNENIISRNIISDNTYGFRLLNSNNNNIYLNNFIHNINNVQTDYLTNIWNSSEKIPYTYNGESFTNYLGNHWNDYSGADAEGDGIGDTPYSIDGDEDHYPLMEPFENYKDSGGLVESPWPMFQYDPQHTGQSPYVGAQQAILRWTYPFEDGAYSQPIIDSNNVIYLRTADGIVHAINPNGTSKWALHVGGNGDSIYGSLAIGKDSTVYVGTETFGSTYDRTLRAFNQNGVLKWQFSTSASVAPAVGPDTSVTLGPDGTAYFLGTKTTNDLLANVLYALDSEGSIKWESVLEGFAHSAPAIASDGSIYLASQKLWALDDDGVPKWSFGATSDSRYGQPIVGSDGTIYMTAIEPGTTPGGQNLVAVHPNGTLKWRIFVDTAGYSQPRPAISEDNTIYLAGTVGRYIIAINASNGSLKWSYQTNEWLWPTTPVISADGTIYVGSEFSKFSAINRDGTLKWEYVAEQDISVGPYYTPAAIGSDGTVYVATYSANGNHHLYAFGPGPTPENRPPTCVIKLRKEGVEISEIDVGEFLDIYVGDSNDDTGIKEVRFSSDDVQDGVPTGEWTEWYNWDISSGDWDASNRIKRWAFATGGDKEVWAEVKDDIGQTDKDYSNIFVSITNILPVPYYYQGDTSWCVSTSMSMIFKYYGQNVHPWDIAKDWGWSIDDYGVQPLTVSNHFKNNGLTTDMCIVTAFPPSFQSIRDWIDEGMPVLLSMNSIDHAVVLVGYDIIGECEKVYINDPSSALVNTEMGLSESYPYVAIEVNWNELACYINPLSYLIAVGGTPQTSEGTIDLFQTFNYKAVRFGHRYRGQWSGIYSWYASDRGLIWERSEDHALTLNSRDQFQYSLCFVNHMKYNQVYLFEIEFAKYEESISTWIPASVIWLPISIGGNSSTSKISQPISLGDLLKEYGKYKLTLRLWNEDCTEEYDEIVFPSIEYGPLIEFYLGSPADLYVTDPQGFHIGVDPSTGESVNEIQGAIFTGPGFDPQVIAIPDPLDGHYEVQLIGTATGIYSLTTDLVTLQEILNQTYTGEIVENAIYVYSITINEGGMTSNPDPIAELEYLEQFIMNLPDEVFVSDDPYEFTEFKKEMADKIYETIEELYENKYLKAVEKLSEMKGEVTDEEKLQESTKSKLCININHIISHVRS